MPIRIVHVGTGLRGSHWLEYVRDHADTRTVAVVDPDAKALSKAKTIVQSPSVDYVEDLSDALGYVEADAAIIASSSSLHAAHARQCMDAGLAVMVEKPFTTSVSDAIRLNKLSKETQRPIMVAENFRFVPAERTVRKLIQDNVLGNVSTVVLTDRRRQPASTQGPWVAKMDYAQLREIAIHHFDSLRGFFERRPISICTQVYNPGGTDYKHGACSKALIELDGGIHVTYLGTLTSQRYAYSLRIEGDRGELWTNRKWILVRKRGSRFFFPVKPVAVAPGDGKPYPREGTTSLLNQLRDAVQHGRVPETHGEDNIWNVAMVQAGLLSDQEGRTVRIDEIMEQA